MLSCAARENFSRFDNGGSCVSALTAAKFGTTPNDSALSAYLESCLVWVGSLKPGPATARHRYPMVGQEQGYFVTLGFVEHIQEGRLCPYSVPGTV